MFNWKDPTTWERLLAVGVDEHSSDEDILIAFGESYGAVIAYHGCRPLDPGRYYKLGLELANHAALNDDARSIFLSGDFPELDGSAIDKAIATLATSNQQRASVILDDRVLLDGAGHYLIYGSEHLCGIAASLSGPTSRDYRQALKGFGTPTMFTVRVPIGRAWKSGLTDIPYPLRHGLEAVRAGDAPDPLDFTLTLHHPLPPECIVGHVHPKSIADPLLGMELYYL